MNDGPGECSDSLTLRRKVPNGLLRVAFQAAELQCSQRLLRLLRFGRAAGFEHGEGDVFQNAERRKECAGREKKTERPESQGIAFSSRQSRDLGVAQPDFPCIGFFEEPEHMEQKIFSAAFGAGHGVEFPRTEFRAHAAHV